MNDILIILIFFLFFAFAVPFIFHTSLARIQPKKILLLESPEYFDVKYLPGIFRTHTDETKKHLREVHANKTTWNAGILHSNSTKDKISKSIRAYAFSIKVDKAFSLGLSVAEYDVLRKRTAILRAKMKKKESMNTTNNKPSPSKNRTRVARSRSKSPRKKKEKKELIDLSNLNLFWKNNTYRPANRTAEERRKSLSETIKEKWRDPEYRDKTVKGIQEYSNRFGNKIMEKFKINSGETKKSSKQNSQPIAPVIKTDPNRQFLEELATDERFNDICLIESEFID